MLRGGVTKAKQGDIMLYFLPTMGRSKKSSVGQTQSIVRAKGISDAAYSAVSNAVSSLGWSIIPAGLRVGSVAVPVAMVIGIAAVITISVRVYRSIGTAVIAIAVVVAGTGSTPSASDGANLHESTQLEGMAEDGMATTVSVPRTSQECSSTQTQTSQQY